MSVHARISGSLDSQIDGLARALQDVATYLEGTGAAWGDSPYSIFDRSALRRRIGPVFDDWLRLRNCLDKNVVLAIDPSFQKIFGDTKCVEWETGDIDHKVGLIPKVTMNPKGNVYLYNESIRQFCRGVRSLPRISVEQVESIDSIIPFLSESDKQVFQTIHDFEHKPYPTEPEQLEGCDEMYAPQPKSITPVPWYFLKGAHWPVDPSPSLLALTRFGLIRQPNGVYHRSVHCRLPTGRVLRVEYKLTRTAAASDGKPSHFVVVYVDGRDEFCEDSATWVAKPNAFELTQFGLRFARRLFEEDSARATQPKQTESEGAKLPSDGTPKKASDARLKPSHQRARALYEWAMENIASAENMTYAQLHKALTEDSRCEGDGLPDNAEAFQRYCRAAGIRRNSPVESRKQTSRSVRKASQL